MKFKKYEFLSKAGTLFNEDSAYADFSFGWVIDGATGLSDNNLTGTESDAKWFVGEWDNYLRSVIRDEALDLKAIVIKGIDEIGARYALKAGTPLDKVNKLDIASASIAIVRLVNDRVEYFALGDCTILYEKAGEIKAISDGNLRILDDKVLAFIKNRISKGESFNEARRSAHSLLVENRLLRNTGEGYWSLELDKKAVDNAIYGFIDELENTRLLLMTDGFSCIHYTYKALELTELLDTIENDGLERVYDLIRSIENDDESCTRFIRFKKSDDSSAAYFVI